MIGSNWGLPYVEWSGKDSLKINRDLDDEKRPAINNTKGKDIPCRNNS